jgi:carbon storage regulator
MLLLTRRIGEKIIIGNNITVVVVGKNGNQIKIGIEAPKDVNIRREELPPLEKKYE